jgi:putative ABC transport system permease protein
MEAVIAASPNPAANLINLILIEPKNEADTQALVDDLNAQFYTLTAQTKAEMITAKTGQISSSLFLPMIFIGLIFCLATFLIIYSTCNINIRKESKSYGIYKSLGMTSGQIRRSITFGIGVLAALGAVCGIFIGIYVLPNILELVSVNFGLAEFPAVINLGGVITMSLIAVVAAAAGSWASSRLVRSTSPRMLVVE